MKKNQRFLMRAYRVNPCSANHVYSSFQPRLDFLFICLSKQKMYKRNMRNEHQLCKTGKYFELSCTDINNFNQLEVAVAGHNLSL